MTPPTTEDVLRFAREYFKARKGSLVHDYTLHVSLCGSLDTFELVAHDRENDMYFAASCTYEDMSGATAFGEVLGPLVVKLLNTVREHEAALIKGY